MLDTDTCIFITRKSAPVLLERIESVPLAQQCISVVTLAELLYGVQLSARKKANQQVVDLFARHVEVLDWTPDAARHYAEIRADLKKKGQQLRRRRTAQPLLADGRRLRGAAPAASRPGHTARS
jgi:tRNA(fMet)-specific endonuclease VapC